MPDLTEYAEDQLRRVREHIQRFPYDPGMCVTASCCNGSEVPALWLELEKSGHVTIMWADPFTAYVKPVA